MPIVTPIPAYRASTRADVELRILREAAASAVVTVHQQGKAVAQQCFDLGDEQVACVHPELSRCRGELELDVSLLDARGSNLGSTRLPYEIVDTGVRSTRLLDGAWISIYHWSESEARWFNRQLAAMTAADWRDQLADMNRVGIKSVVIQNVFDSTAYVHQHSMTADSYEGRAFYPSTLYPARMPITCEDPIEAVLAAADEFGMFVFLGVGLYAWFDYSPESLEWHKRVTAELFQRYGHHPSLYSWYVSEEMFGAFYYDYPPVPDEKWRDVAEFFREYRRFCAELTPTKPISMAPNNIRFHEFEEQWLAVLENIDILIPFAFARDLDHLNISEIAEITRRAGTRFWVDLEMFAWPLDDGLIPKPHRDLVSEIALYDDVEQILGYQYTGIMNSPEARVDLGGQAPRTLYRHYRDLYDRRHDE